MLVVLIVAVSKELVHTESPNHKTRPVLKRSRCFDYGHVTVYKHPAPNEGNYVEGSKLVPLKLIVEVLLVFVHHPVTIIEPL